MNAATATFRLGALTFSVVSDGTIAMPVSMFFKTLVEDRSAGLPEEGAASAARPASRSRRMEDVPPAVWQAEVPDLEPDGYADGSMNCILVRSDGKLVLIDTGLGTKPSTRAALNSLPGRDAGTLLRNLAALGVRPEDIDIVVLTHAHADHIGWCTVEHDGQFVPTFTRATYWLLRADWEFFAAPHRLAKYPVLRENLEPLRERVVLADCETAVTPNVLLWRSPGHTLGHACVALHAGGHYAMHIGDVVHHPVEFERPEWLAEVDYDGRQTIASRHRVAEWALAHDALLIAAHTPFPGTGRLRRQRWGLTWDEAEKGEPGRAP